MVVGAVLGIDALADDVQGEQAVAADLFDDEEERPTRARAQIDDLATAEQIFGVLGDS